MREYARIPVPIFDDLQARAHSHHAADLYELVTECAAQGGSMSPTSNRAPVDWYPLVPNPVVAESLLDRLINTSHQIFMSGLSYRPHKKPQAGA